MTEQSISHEGELDRETWLLQESALVAKHITPNYLACLRYNWSDEGYVDLITQEGAKAVAGQREHQYRGEQVRSQVGTFYTEFRTQTGSNRAIATQCLEKKWESLQGVLFDTNSNMEPKLKWLNDITFIYQWLELSQLEEAHRIELMEHAIQLNLLYLAAYGDNHPFLSQTRCISIMPNVLIARLPDNQPVNSKTAKER